MSIQSSLNQVAGLGVVGFTQSATYKAKTEEKLREKQVARLDEEASITERALHESTGTEENPKYDPKVEQDEARRLYSIRQELYRSDPTQERFKAYTSAGERLLRANESPKFTVANRRNEALFNTEQKRQNKIEQSKIIQDNINRWGEINGKK